MKKFLLRKEFLLPFALIIITSIIYFAYIGDIKVFRSDDEPLYTHIASEMNDANEFWVPLRFGEPAFFKPPFLYWTMIFFFKLFGSSILTARIPVAIMTIASIFLVYIIGKDLFGIISGFISSLILATSFGVITYGRVALMDTPLMFLILLSVYFFHLAIHPVGSSNTVPADEHTTKARARYHDLNGKICPKLSNGVNKNKSWGIFGFFAAAALSTLVKGPISGLILFLFILAYCLFFKTWAVFKTKWTICGIITGTVIMLLWPFMIYLNGLWHEWFSFFIVRENFGKFTDMQYPIPHFLSYYLEFLFPWSLFFLTGLILIIVRKLYKKNEYGFLLLILMSCVIVFFFPAIKLKHFLIPALPYGALIIGGIIKDFRESFALKTTSCITILFFLILLAVIGAVSWMGLNANYFIPSLLAGVFLLICIWYLIKNKVLECAVSYSFFVIFLIMIWSAINLPLLSPEAITYLKQNKVYAVKRQIYVYAYFLRTPVLQIEEPAQFPSILPETSRIVISENDLNKFRKDKNFGKFNLKNVYSWQYWKEDISIPEFFSALKNKDTEKLKENIYIFKINKP